jgi:hypothetical protein
MQSKTETPNNPFSPFFYYCLVGCVVGGGGDVEERSIANFPLLTTSTLMFSATEVPVAASASGSAAVILAGPRCCRCWVCMEMIHPRTNLACALLCGKFLSTPVHAKNKIKDASITPGSLLTALLSWCGFHCIGRKLSHHFSSAAGANACAAAGLIQDKIQLP